MYRLGVIISMLFLAGCYNAQGMADLQTSWQKRNESVHLAVGEREIAADEDTIIKGIITASSEINMSVTNLDTNIDFIIIEGSGIISGEIEKRIAEEEVIPEMNEASGIRYKYLPGNYKIRANISLYERDEFNTLVKMRISSTVNASSDTGGGLIHELPTPYLKEHYKVIWEAIDRNIFIEREST